MADPRSNETTRWSIQHVTETGSTNTDLLAAAAAGAPHGSVLVTDHQTAGRGRLGRGWDAPPGVNLLVSILFREGFAPDRPHEVTQRVAVAAARAAEATVGVTPDLKWPNDLLVDGCKLAGILAQAVSRDGRVDHVVVGMGLNLGWAPEGAARLGGVARDDLLTAVLAELADGLRRPIHPEYRTRLATLGQRVRVERPGGDLVGVAVDVTTAGELVVDGPQGLVTVSVGDVVHLRPATGV